MRPLGQPSAPFVRQGFAAVRQRPERRPKTYAASFDPLIGLAAMRCDLRISRRAGRGLFFAVRARRQRPCHARAGLSSHNSAAIAGPNATAMATKPMAKYSINFGEDRSSVSGPLPYRFSLALLAACGPMDAAKPMSGTTTCGEICELVMISSFAPI